MSTANELWRKKESPLWLLLASRSCAQYPTSENINNERVREYVDQFSSSKLPDLKDIDYLEKLHLGHKELFGLFASEALSYYSVLYNRQAKPYDDYTAELVAQYDKAYEPEKVVGLKNYQINENPQVICNMIVAVAIATIRDMSLVEDLHRQGKLNDEEHEFALSEINDRMSRVGINGVDKLLESRPELDDFLRHDTREINIGHIAGQLKHTTKTRAACYNVRGIHLHNFSFGKEALTDLRRQLFGKEFVELEESKDSFMIRRIDDVPPLSEETRKKASSDYKRNAFSSPHEYNQFLIHDGIAINHPNRNTYAESVREALKEKKDGPKAEIIPQGTKIEGDIIDITDQNSEPAEHNAALLPAVVKKDDDKSKAPNTDHIEEAEVVEFTETPADPDKKNEVIEVMAEADEPKAKPDTSDSKDTPAPSKSKSVGKITALGGAAALAGLLLSGKSEHRDDSSEPSELRRSHSQKEHHNGGKKLAITAAATVTIGGVILLTRKPEVLYKPLKEMIEKLSGGIGRA
jgi:hypothetical protein